jgi:hypothetical protein
MRNATPPSTDCWAGPSGVVCICICFSVAVSGDPEPSQHRTSQSIRDTGLEKDCVPQSTEISSCGHDLYEERINGGQIEIAGTPLPSGIADFISKQKDQRRLARGELHRTIRCRLNRGQTHVGWRLLFLYRGDKEHHYSDRRSRAWRAFLPAKAA